MRTHELQLTGVGHSGFILLKIANLGKFCAANHQKQASVDRMCFDKSEDQLLHTFTVAMLFAFAYYRSLAYARARTSQLLFGGFISTRILISMLIIKIDKR